MQIREDIRTLRDAGISQEEMRRLLGVGRRSLRRWELGTHAPMIPEVRAILRDWAERVRQWQSQSSVS